MRIRCLTCFVYSYSCFITSHLTMDGNKCSIQDYYYIGDIESTTNIEISVPQMLATADGVFEKPIELNLSSNNCSNNENIEKNKENNIPKKIWLPNVKPNEVDIIATEIFLQKKRGLEKYRRGFADKKTSKIKLWTNIAGELKSEGYDCGIGKEGAEKCRQKFANLQSRYFSHIRHMNTTGERKKDPPPFFDLIHDILGEKHKSTPEFLSETDVENVSYNEDNSDNKYEEPPVKKAREASNDTDVSDSEGSTCYKNIKKTVKVKSKTDEIMKVLKEEKEERKEQMKNLNELINVQNQQRERLLDIMETLVSDIRKSKN